MTKERKIAFVFSGVHNAISFEWFLSKLDEEFIVILLLDMENSVFEEFLKKKQITYFRIESIKLRNYFSILVQLYRTFRKHKINVVHTHLMEANLLGLGAAFLAGIKKRITTRHHSTLYHKYFRKSVFVDKVINLLASDVIAISQTVEQVLVNQENVSKNKIKVIHHGFDLEYFTQSDTTETDIVKSNYSITSSDFVVGVVSRYTEWKGIQYIIPAFKKFLSVNPNAKLILANALGDYDSTLGQLLKEIPRDRYVEIEYERNMPALYRSMNVLVHTPIDNQIEAFGQIYIEAMLCKTPTIITLSGIANEYAVDRENALVVGYNNSEDIYKALCLIWKDEQLSQKIKKNGYELAVNNFNIDSLVENMQAIYA